jgi:two-component system chemotaxis response regulator CheB
MRNIICMGGSTGALDAIQLLLRRLPADLPAAIFLVRHIAPESTGVLADILQRHTALPVAEAVDGEPIQEGRVIIAPANRHLLLDRTHVHLATGPKENWARPAIDPLFRTAAQYHGPRVIGIVLSGKLDDGTAGLWAIKRRGGLAIVQDPADARAPEMPRHAIAAVDVDVVAHPEEIGTLLPQWCRESTDFAVSELTDKIIKTEIAPMEKQPTDATLLNEVGVSAGVVCPDCGGQLWRMKEGPLRYRCHVGHALSAHTFLAEQTEVVESAGWQLIRAIEEDDQLCEQMLEQRLSRQAKEALMARLARNREKLERLRSLLFGHEGEAAMPLSLSLENNQDNDAANERATETRPEQRA